MQLWPIFAHRPQAGSPRSQRTFRSRHGLHANHRLDASFFPTGGGSLASLAFFIRLLPLDFWAGLFAWEARPLNRSSWASSGGRLAKSVASVVFMMRRVWVLLKTSDAYNFEEAQSVTAYNSRNGLWK